MSKIDWDKLSSILIPVDAVRITGRRKKRSGHFARELPDKKGKGLWTKDAFDLVVAKKGCKHAIEVETESDARIEGFAEESKKKICNRCIFLEWNEDERYFCTNSEDRV